MLNCSRDLRNSQRTEGHDRALFDECSSVGRGFHGKFFHRDLIFLTTQTKSKPGSSLQPFPSVHLFFSRCHPLEILKCSPFSSLPAPAPHRPSSLHDLRPRAHPAPAPA